MTVFFNFLFIFVSIMFFAGRLYEVLHLVEEGTYFITQRGIVTTPLMLAIVFLISVCCGVLIFSDEKQSRKALKIPVGIFGFAAAVLFIVSSVLNIIRIFTVTGGFLGYDIMMILAAVGLIIYGVTGIKGKKKEKLPMLLTMLFPVAMCMHSVMLDIQPIGNTFFLYRSLSAITSMLFFLLLFKNAYSPTGLSRPMLYIASLLNYLISGVAMLAGIIGGLINSYIGKAELLLYGALVITGVYSLFVSFYIMPIKSDKNKKAARMEDDIDDEWEDDDTAQEYTPLFPSAVAVTDYETQPSYADSDFGYDKGYREANKISEETIAFLFSQKEETQQYSEKIVEKQAPPVEVTQNTSLQSTRITDTVKKDIKTEKSVFKSTGAKRSTTAKTVYKAPKK